MYLHDSFILTNIFSHDLYFTYDFFHDSFFPRFIYFTLFFSQMIHLFNIHFLQLIYFHKQCFTSFTIHTSFYTIPLFSHNSLHNRFFHLYFFTRLIDIHMRFFDMIHWFSFAIFSHFSHYSVKFMLFYVKINFSHYFFPRDSFLKLLFHDIFIFMWFFS